MDERKDQSFLVNYDRQPEISLINITETPNSMDNCDRSNQYNQPCSTCGLYVETMKSSEILLHEMNCFDGNNKKSQQFQSLIETQLPKNYIDSVMNEKFNDLTQNNHRFRSRSPECRSFQKLKQTDNVFEAILNEYKYSNWFHFHLSIENALFLLENTPAGTFMVVLLDHNENMSFENSNKSINVLEYRLLLLIKTTLSIVQLNIGFNKHQSSIKRWIIVEQDANDLTFESLNDLLEWYRRRELPYTITCKYNQLFGLKLGSFVVQKSNNSMSWSSNSIILSNSIL